MNNLITTWLDVIQEIPQYFDWDTGLFVNITKGKIIDAIEKEEKIIRSKLRPFYGTDLSIGVDEFSTFCLNTNFEPDFVFTASGITVNTQFTQVFKFAFQETSNETETNKVVVTPDQGSIVNGDITSPINLTYITLGTTSWGGFTFQKGDTVFLVQHHYESTLVDLVTKAAAARILERTSNSQLAADGPSAQNLRSDVNNILDMIRDQFDNLLEIPLKAQDLSQEPIDYDINELGYDDTEYLDE